MSPGAVDTTRHAFPGLFALEAPAGWRAQPPADPRSVLLLALPGDRGILEVLPLAPDSGPGPAELLASMLARPPAEPARPFDHPGGHPAVRARIDHPDAAQMVALVVGAESAAFLSLTGEPAEADALADELLAVARSVVFLHGLDAGLAGRVCARLAAARPGFELTVLGADALAVRGPRGAGELSLLPLIGRILVQPRAAEPELVGAFCAGADLSALEADRPPPAPDLDSIYPRLLPPGAADEGAATREFVAGFRIGLLDDSRVTGRLLGEGDLRRAGLTWVEAFNRAGQNLEALLGRFPLEGTQGPDGQAAVVAVRGHSHAAAALLLPAFRHELEHALGPGAGVFVPAPDELVALRGDDPLLARMVRENVERTRVASPRPLAGGLFRLEPGAIRYEE